MQSLTDPTSERAVIGSCLLDPDALILVVDRLDAQQFTDPRHVAVWQAICALHRAGSPVDLVTVSEYVRGRVELADLADMTDFVGSTVGVEHYAGRVASWAQARRMVSRLDAVQATLRATEADPAEAIQAAVSEVSALTLDAAPARSASAETLARRYLDRMTGEAESPTYSTGIETLDRALEGGLRRDRLHILAARPGVGKSALSGCVALNMARQGRHVLMFSLEMGADEVVDRMLANLADVHLGSIERPERQTAAERERVAQAAYDFSALALYIEDKPGLRLSQIRAEALRRHARQPLDLVVVDYMQLVRPDRKHSNREGEVGEVSQGCKNLAKELHCPVIALSQLNRNLEREGRRPVMSDLRESGSLEQDADVIAFLWSPPIGTTDPGVPAGQVEFRIAKFRGGQAGCKGNFAFDGSRQRFGVVQQAGYPVGRGW